MTSTPLLPTAPTGAAASTSKKLPTHSHLAFVLAMALVSALVGCRTEGATPIEVQQPSREGQDLWETGIGPKTPSRATDLGSLIDASDLIVLARAVEVSPLEQPPGGFLSARVTLEISEVVKPDEIAPKVALRVPFAEEIGGIGALQSRVPSTSGLAFLVETGLEDPAYEFVGSDGLLIEVDQRAIAPFGDGGPAIATLLGLPLSSAFQATLEKAG